MARFTLALTSVALVLVMSGLSASRADEISTRELVRRYLTPGSDASLLAKILERKPDPDTLASWLGAGEPDPADAPTGWSKRQVEGVDGKKRSWLLHVPARYDPTKRHPLLVDLHDDATRRALPPDLEAWKGRWGTAVAERGWLLAIPTAQRGAEWWTEVGAGNVMRIIGAVKRGWNVDENRVFVAGAGDGANGAYAFALHRPDAFAGFAAVGGHPAAAEWGGRQTHLRSLLGRPLYVVPVTAGSTDPAGALAPVLDALEKLGAPGLVRRPPVEGSLKETFAAEAPKILEWMASRKRDPHPARIVREGSGNRRTHWLSVFGAEAADTGFPDVNPVAPPRRNMLGIRALRSPDSPGVKLSRVDAGSAADAGGLKPGDVILKIGDHDVADLGDLRHALDRHPRAGSFPLVVRRGMKNVRLAITLTPRPDGPAFARWRPFWSVDAKRKGRRIDIEASGVDRFVIRLPHPLPAGTEAFEVRVNGELLFQGEVSADPAVLLREARSSSDRSALYAAEIELPGSAAKAVARILKDVPGKKAFDAIRELEASRRPADDPARAGPSPVYRGLFEAESLTRWKGTPEALFAKVLDTGANAPTAWAMLSEIRDRARDAPKYGQSRVTLLKDWSKSLVAKPDWKGQVIDLALGLFEARLLLDEGKAAEAHAKALDVHKHPDSGPHLEQAAQGLLDRTDVLALRRSAPEFQLPDAGGEAEHTRADLSGRAALVFFDADDRESDRLRKLTASIAEMTEPYEMVVLEVPLAVKAGRSVGGKPPAGWRRAALGAASRKLAAAFGVGKFSAAFLLSPRGAILQNAGWEREESAREAVLAARKEIGTSLAVLLRQAGTTRGWERFREVWRGLAAGDRHLTTGLRATKRAGPRAVLALRLAAAMRGVTLTGAIPPAPDDRHGRLAAAYCAFLRKESPAELEKLLAPLAKTRGDECLAVTDALFDLGMASPAIRTSLENCARKGRDWKLVSTALRALAVQDTDVEPKGLLHSAKSKRWQVRLALAEGLQGYRNVKAVDALIKRLGDKNLRVRGAAAASLEALTGKGFGGSQKRWAKWRRAEGRKLVLVPRRTDAEPTRDRARRYANATANTTYFGLKIASNRVVLVLDKSESMYYGLFDQVVEEVRAFLETAGPTTAFTVVEFAEEPDLWSKSLKPANSMSVKDVVSFLERSKPYGPTNVMDSLQLGMDVPRIDTVILLSDGLPNRGAVTDPKQIVEKVTDANRYARLAIHTIWMVKGRGFPHSMRGEAKPPLDEREKARRRRITTDAGKWPLGRFLRNLSDRNEGSFTVAFGDWYAPPPGARLRPGTDR